MQSTFNKIINCFLKEGIDRTMNIYNTRGWGIYGFLK
jgi:hypothetical protein